MAILQQGCVQVYTGAGKGKTTAALGLAWRMLGQGGRVYICQFLKPANVATGEAALAQRWGDALVWERLEQAWDMFVAADGEAQRASMRGAIKTKLAEIVGLAAEGRFDLMVLDELVYCLAEGLAGQADVFQMIDKRAAHVELVLTGRKAGSALIERADLVTEMTLVKHPYEQGVSARRGVEF